MISLIAIVGADGSLGVRGRLPEFTDAAERDALTERGRTTTLGGVIVIGSNTARLMKEIGIDVDVLGFTGAQNAVWSRRHGISPAAFLHNLTATGKRVFICGGKETFRLFTPFCENFFIWRADIVCDPDNRLDPILPNWQDRPAAFPAIRTRMQ